MSQPDLTFPSWSRDKVESSRFLLEVTCHVLGKVQ